MKNISVSKFRGNMKSETESLKIGDVLRVSTPSTKVDLAVMALDSYLVLKSKADAFDLLQKVQKINNDEDKKDEFSLDI